MSIKLEKYYYNSREYNIWYGMKQRCLNPKSIGYGHYGGLGVTVCNKWKNSFANFLEDMGESPSKKYSLDRINPTGNYEPSNCRWATRKTQANNRRKDISKETRRLMKKLYGHNYPSIIVIRPSKRNFNLKNKLKKLAKEKQMSLSSYILSILVRHVRRMSINNDVK